MRRQKPQRPFGWRRTPFNPGTGAFLPIGDVRSFVDFTVVEAGRDVLLCAGQDGRPALVAKPWSFRRSSFHGVTIDESAYSALSLDTRVVTKGTDSYMERLSPPYSVGEKIVAMRKGKEDRAGVVVIEGELEDVAAGDYALDFEDLNTAGRRWDAAARFRVQVTAIGDNTLTVRLLEDGATGEGGDFAEGSAAFTVWRPVELQRQTYDGLTIGGYDYSYESEQQRGATDGEDTETQIVVPPYYVGSVILVAAVANGGGVGAEKLRLIDLNNAGRQWMAQA